MLKKLLKLIPKQGFGKMNKSNKTFMGRKFVSDEEFDSKQE